MQADDIGAEGPVPVLGLDGLYRCEDAVGGIADEAIQAAETAVDLAENLFEMNGVCHGAPQVDRLAAGGDDLRCCLFTALTGVKGVDGDSRAKAGEVGCDCFAQAV